MNHLEYVGEMVGDYRLLRWLGGGGFGNVYQAEQVQKGQQVAVKVLRIRLSKQDDLRAFINEARTMRLRHPHIVPLLDFGLSHDDTPFLVMEYAPKGTLRDRYPCSTRMPLLTAVAYASQMASALQYAHDAHLVHRDVKPENMLVRSDAVILLSDFGIATVAHSTYAPSLNQELIIGTVTYMAPEQLAGKARAASDQYALAVVIYEWLAGRVPFLGTTIEVAMQHTIQPPPSLIEQIPEIPQEVEAVLFKALAKDYKERFPSIQEFITALQDASAYSTSPPSAFVQPACEEIASSLPLLPLVGDQTPVPLMTQSTITQPTELMLETISVRENKSSGSDTPSQSSVAGINSTNVPVPPSVRNHRISKRMGLIFLIVLLIAGGSYAYLMMGSMRITTAKPVNIVKTVNVAKTINITKNANPVNVAYDVAVAQHGIMFGFDAARTHNNPYEHILSGNSVTQLHQAWTAVTGGLIDFSSPVIDNGFVYIASYDGKLYAFDASSGQQKWIAATGRSINSSPAVANGVVYIGSNDGSLYAFDASTCQQKWAAATGSKINFSSPIVANGMVYIGSDDHKLHAFDASSGSQKWAAATGGYLKSSPAMANGVIYIGSYDSKLYAFDASSGQQKWTATTGSYIKTSPAVFNRCGVCELE